MLIRWAITVNIGLTSFRAFAFFAVFLFHTTTFKAGYLGVQAFFVLSGFLLTPILVSMKKDLTFRDYFINFYGRRALRIFPLYYGYLLTVGIIALIVANLSYGRIEHIDRFFSQLPWALTYTYNFFHASSIYKHTHLVTHFWSLAVEEQFYLFWPLLIFLIPPNKLNKMLILIIIFGPIFRFLTSLVIRHDPLNIINDRVDLAIYVLPFSHIDAFAVGGYFALYKKANKAPLLAWMLIFSVLALGCTTQYISTGDILVMSLGYPPFMNGKYTWGYSVLNLMFAYLLVQIRDDRFIPALFNNKWINYIGVISYGLYVFHFPIILLMSYYLSGYKHILVSLFLSILISSLSYELFEKRFLSFKEVLFARRTANKALHSSNDSTAPH